MNSPFLALGLSHVQSIAPASNMNTRQTAITIGGLAIALAVLTGALYGLTAFGQNGTSGPEHTLLVSGIGEVKVDPDRAKIMIGVITEGLTVKEAADSNAKITASLLAALEQMGITKDRIETIWYNVYPVYDYNNIRNFPVIIGYRVEHQMRVTVLAEEVSQLGVKAGEVIDAAVTAGANQIYGVEFTVSEEQTKELRNMALQKAVTEAAAKAKLMADALGVKLSGVLTVNEGATYFPPPIRFASGAEVKQGTQVLPGSLSVSASVQVTYTVA